MPKADCVHSTPPTNTSVPTPQSSRRGFLVQATAAAAAGAALGASLPLPEPLAVTAQSCDAELINLGAQFEPVLDHYYGAQRRWSAIAARARSEHDREFGNPADQNYEYTPEIVAALGDSYDRSGATKAEDALHAIHDEMKSLADAINAAPVSSIGGLRVKALVAFWEVAPVRAGDTEFSFDDAYPFQQLFMAVADVCGLKDKIAATGYELPDIGLVNDDREEDCDDEAEDA
jgi:hypothetical protein